MASDQSDRMDALSEAILRLLRRQEETDRRLAAIETTLGVGSPAPAVSAEPAPLAPPPSEAQPLPRPEKPQLETKLGLAWVNRIGAVTLALFVAFSFKYAVDNAWIGPAGRVALGALAGLSAMAVADRTWRGGQKVYAQGISGLGIAILYLSFYASFGFYRLIDPGFAFVLMAVATAMAAAAALRYDSAAIAGLGLLGGYATPVLLSTGEDRPWALFTWVLILNAGAVAATRLRRWRKLEILAFAATALLYGGWLLDRFSPEKQAVAVLFAFVFYALFAVSDSPAIFYLAQLLATLAMPPIWRQQLGLYSLCSLALAAAGLAISDLRRRTFGISVTFAAFWAAYSVWSDTARRPPVSGVFLLLTGAFLLFLCWIPWRAIFRCAAFARQDALLLAFNGLVYFGVCYELLRADYHAWLGLFAVSLAGAHLAIAFLLWRNLPRQNRDTRPALLAAGIALTFVTLAAPIQFSEYRITMAWSLEMAALAWIGRRAGSKWLTYASLAVFALALSRLEGIDSWLYYGRGGFTPFANARFLTFAIAAAASWASAYWLRAGIQAAAVYLGGHFIMLWGLGLEAIAWVDLKVAQDQRSAESAAISILMASYAVLMIGGGVLSRSALNRIVGLGLIGLVVVKLYLYDVWLLDRIYRIAAFGALGALLLLTSYVYSRNRASIENWWNERNPGS